MIFENADEKDRPFSGGPFDIKKIAVRSGRRLTAIPIFAIIVCIYKDFAWTVRDASMKKITGPRAIMITSMAIFGTLAPFVRNISVSSGELALYRAVLAALMIAVFLLVTKQKIPFANIRKEVPWLIASGMAMGINWVLLFEAYKYTTVSVATLSYYFAPVIVTVVSPILFKERLTRKQILCFIRQKEKGAAEDEMVR